MEITRDQAESAGIVSERTKMFEDLKTDQSSREPGRVNSNTWRVKVPRLGGKVGVQVRARASVDQPAVHGLMVEDVWSEMVFASLPLFEYQQELGLMLVADEKDPKGYHIMAKWALPKISGGKVERYELKSHVRRLSSV